MHSGIPNCTTLIPNYRAQITNAITNYKLEGCTAFTVQTNDRKQSRKRRKAVNAYASATGLLHYPHARHQYTFRKKRGTR